MVSKDALNKVLDDSVSAIKNVNEKINTAKNLTDKESVAAFTVTSELKEQVKVAVKSEVQNPGSSEIKSYMLGVRILILILALVGFLLWLFL